MGTPTIAKTLGDMERAERGLQKAVAEAIKTDFDHDHIVRRFANDEDWLSCAKAALRAVAQHEQKR